MEKYLRLAVELARENDFPKWPMASVLVTPGGVVVGRNSLKSHPRSPERVGRGGRSNKHARHAEFDAIIKALARYGSTTVEGSRLYVARVSVKSGEPRLAKPCSNCQSLIDEFKLQVVYTIH